MSRCVDHHSVIRKKKVSNFRFHSYWRGYKTNVIYRTMTTIVSPLSLVGWSKFIGVTREFTGPYYPKKTPGGDTWLNRRARGPLLPTVTLVKYQGHWENCGSVCTVSRWTGFIRLVDGQPILEPSTGQNRSISSLSAERDSRDVHSTTHLEGIVSFNYLGITFGLISLQLTGWSMLARVRGAKRARWWTILQRKGILLLGMVKLLYPTNFCTYQFFLKFFFFSSTKLFYFDDKNVFINS